jgi:4-hydroxybenzoate polyprenyltransferase
MAMGDILYAFLDIEFDRERKVYSLPAKYGERAALITAFVLVVLTAITLVMMGVYAHLSSWYYIGALLMIVILFNQLYNVQRSGKSSIMQNFAFSHILFPFTLLLSVIVGVL